MSNTTTGIIIPCYNEENRLNTQAFIDFAQSHPDHILCFVNDGSSDDTIKVLNSMKLAVPQRIQIVHMEKNVGKAEAVRAGALSLYQDSSIDYIGFIDADLSTDFNDFKALVQTLKDDEKLEMVYGSRNKEESQHVDRNFFRNIFSKIIKTFIYLILRLPIEDTQCGAKVFKRELIGIAFMTPFLTRWLFDIEIFIKLKRHYSPENIMNYIHEQPLKRWVHVEDSKLGLKDAIQIPYRLVSIWYSYKFAA